MSIETKTKANAVTISKSYSYGNISDVQYYTRIKKRVFKRLRDIIFSTTGINLSDKKISLLENRLNKRLRLLGIDSFEAYLMYLDDGKNQEEMVAMLDCVSTNETAFFREPHQFVYLERNVFPYIKANAEAGRRSKTVKVWSAACSTGDELYSAAMCLLTHFPREQGWAINALGTDISTKALSTALKGVWPISRSETIPPVYLKRFMLRGIGEHEGLMAAGQEIRDVVYFKRLNLFTDSFAEQRSYDVIFCRNVMIYFNRESKDTVINKLLDSLAPGGYLLIGHAETLHGIDQRLKRHAPTVYSKK